MPGVVLEQRAKVRDLHTRQYTARDVQRGIASKRKDRYERGGDVHAANQAHQLAEKPRQHQRSPWFVLGAVTLGKNRRELLAVKAVFALRLQHPSHASHRR